MCTPPSHSIKLSDFCRKSKTERERTILYTSHCCRMVAFAVVAFVTAAVIAVVAVILLYKALNRIHNRLYIYIYLYIKSIFTICIYSHCSFENFLVKNK